MFSIKKVSSPKRLSPQPGSPKPHTENLFQEELMFLEDSYSNLVADLRQCQQSNYVLTGELSRSQELNMNVTDELHACQHANAILRGELQRLEVENMHLNDSNKLYEKQAKIWKADNKHLEDSLLQHQKITAYIKSKFETLKEKIADDSLSSSLHKNPVEDIVVDIINLMKSYTEIEKRSESPDGTSKDLELKKTSTENHSLTILNETQNPQHKRNETGPTLSNVDVTITTNGRKSAILTENDLESINSSPNNLTYTLKSPQLVRFDQTPKMYQYNTIHSDPHAKDESPRIQRTQISAKNLWEV